MESSELKIKIKVEKEVEERKDPTSFLPEEPMSYEIKKKKKKKKKQQEDDPFKDVEDNVFDTERMDTTMGPILDPEVTIKVENIDCDLDFNDFLHDGEMLLETEGNQSHEPQVNIEQGSHQAAILTFENVNKNLFKTEIDENGEVRETQTLDKVCPICHLIFKNQRTLQLHQKRKHKIFRRSFTHSCPHCNMSYEFKTSLQTHIKRKHGPNAVDESSEKTCEICALVFKGTSRLRIHMRRKHGAFEDSFNLVCEDCGMTYDKAQSLLVHRRRKHATKPAVDKDLWLSCPFCPKAFNRRETYARHMQRKHHTNEDGVLKCTDDIFKSYRNDAGEIVCKLCPLVFSSVNYLRIHMRRKHNALKDSYRLKCKICNLSYDKIESLKRHVKRKHDEGSFCTMCDRQFSNREAYLNHSHTKLVKECNVCGVIFSTQGGLAKHMRCTHKIASPLIAFCNICNKGFHDKRQVKPHQLREHYKVSYPCPFCKKSFKARESYRRHVLFKHPKGFDSSVQLCEQCSESFEDEFELCKHVNLAHRGLKLENAPKVKNEVVEDDEFHCIKCTEKYQSWDQLRAHYEQNHLVDKTCQCQICGEIVKEKELRKHIKQAHTVAEELKCRFCDFKTDSKVRLTQHMLRHENATTLDCDYPNCRYKTFYEDAMNKHKAKHTDQGVKLQCSKCTFQTMNKYILKYHEEAHLTGKKKYACDQCDYSTILPANLVQHKYKHSAIKRFKCDVCSFATKYNTSLRLHVKKKHCDLPTS